MPAEVLREREEVAAPEAPFPSLVPSPPTAAPSTDYTSKIQGIADKLYGTADAPGQKDREVDATRARGSALAQPIADYKAAAAQPMPTPPVPPALAPAPSKGLHAFLAPVEGESPQAAIQKLIAATGVFATGLGYGGKTAKLSLAALTGAMAGWHEGNKERADRAVADWKNQTDAALASWETQRKAYDLALTGKSMDLAQRLEAVKLAAVEADNNVMVEAVASQGLQGAIDTYSKLQGHADALQQKRDVLANSIEQKERDRDLRRELAEMQDSTRRDLGQARLEEARAKREEKTAAEKAQRDELDAAYTPEVIRPLAITFATKGTLPPNIARGKSGQFLIPKITADAIAWAHENGLDPNEFPALQAEIKAADKALTKLSGVNVVQEASIRRFDGHLDKLIDLSSKVPRTQRPLANEYILKGRRDWSGDVPTANYILQGLEVGMELAKVFVGTAQGDAATREEARKAFAAGSTHEQLLGIVDTLRTNAHRNLESNKESEAAASGVLKAAMKGKPKAAKIRVRRKSDGVEGTIDAKDFDDAAYERIGGR